MEQHRLEKCNKLREMGLNPYVNSHIITSPIADILEKYSSSETELPEGEEFSAAGRILAKREFGKTAFLTIRDRSGIIQVYIKKALLTEEEFEVYTLTDVGYSLAPILNAMANWGTDYKLFLKLLQKRG